MAKLTEAGARALDRLLPGASVAHDEPEERWPLPYTAILVTASSVVIWALIIAGVRWAAG